MGLPDASEAWVGWVIAAVYYIGFWTWRGQSPGEMALRIKTYRTDATSVGFGTAILRYVVGYTACALTLGIGFLMIAFDGRKQGLHDKIAGTHVVEIL
jgi:uncharacterized RDD family membrane protein YckC